MAEVVLESVLKVNLMGDHGMDMEEISHHLSYLMAKGIHFNYDFYSNGANS